MLAYNQFSSNSNLQTSGQGGGLGRKGAQRLLILETDGMANQASSVPFVNSVTAGGNPVNNSYFNVGGNNATTKRDPPGRPMRSTSPRRWSPWTTDHGEWARLRDSDETAVTIHCIAFGALFNQDANGAAGGNQAMTLLQTLSALGGTGFPSSVTDTGSPYFYKLCVGTLAQRQSKLQTAFTKIMDDGINIIMRK